MTTHSEKWLEQKINQLEDKIFNLETENSLLKKQLKRKENELEIARRLINSYYEENKHDVNKYLEERKQEELSDGAKRFIHDIERGLYDETI